MKKSFSILVLFLLTFPLQAQYIYEPGSFFRTVNMEGSRTNPYYFGGNPAFLNYSYNSEMLNIAASYNNEQGGFRRFFDPGEERNYQLSFRGKKTLDNNQVFQGKFAFAKEERHEWSWLASKNYDNGNPFLLGDSTTGRSRYNGIFMEAEYAATLFDIVLAGFRLDYGVDEGLKEIAPRPVSEHRDINLNLGLGYILNKNFTAGINFGSFDLNEKINYSEDEGSIYNETILFKLRGYDLPFRISKKTETRYAYHNGYNGGGQFMYTDGRLSASFYGGAGYEKLTAKEDPSRPVSVGHWENNIYNAGVKASYFVTPELEAGLEYTFESSDNWARHPLYDILYSEGDRLENSAALGLAYAASRNSRITGEFEAGIFDAANDDYYSGISWETKGTNFRGGLGAEVAWSKNLKTTAAVSYGVRSVDDFAKTETGPSVFYEKFTYRDLLFYGTNFNETRIFLKSEIDPGFAGLFNLYLNYASLSAEDNTSLFDSRDYFDVTLEFRIKAY